MRLMEHRVPEERAFLLNRRRMEGVAWSIIHQAWNESIDAMIMGRHGFSKLQDIFIGITTKDGTHMVKQVPNFHELAR
jgi:nucleotide-binding universal stress UspA family protein